MLKPLALRGRVTRFSKCSSAFWMRQYQIRPASTRTYAVSAQRDSQQNTQTIKDAIAALNTLQTNHAALEAFRQQGGSINKYSLPEMLEWFRRAGYHADDLNSLNAIHIAGTKGKGSTAAFVASILNQYHLAGRHDLVGKVGLYTSPHLRFVRERIQLDGKHLAESAFADSFFEIWDRLERFKDPVARDKVKPLYFRFLTIVGFHTFLKENVDAAVIECGIGGEYDSTNILQKPMVTGITSLGIDHVLQLGPTIDSIAWHKAGIMKPGASCFTMQQPPEAMQVLQDRAAEKGVELTSVGLHPQIASGNARLGSNGEFQKKNASLAVELAASYLKNRGLQDLDTTILPIEFRHGLEKVHLGGRCEIRQEPNLKWYIDGAHTLESIQVTGQWYSSQQRPEQSNTGPRILLFNQQTRAGLPLLTELYRIVAENYPRVPAFTHVIFCSNVTYSSSGYRPDLISINANASAVQDLEVQQGFAEGWKGIDTRSEVHILPTIEEAVLRAREIAKTSSSNQNIDSSPSVLATGSIHLIGGVLDVLEEVPP